MHRVSTCYASPVGIGLALRTNRFSLTQLTNGVPVRLSSFNTNFVSVDYAVVGTNGPVASGTLEFAPGETLKNIPPFWPTTNDAVLEVLLKNPVRGEITSLGQAWFLGQAGTNSGPIQLVSAGSRWKYNDTGTDLGTVWQPLSYNDATWSNGVAQLGFNDNDEQTFIRRTNSAGVSIITYYFRQTFVVSDPSSLADLSMWLLRDDGGVVYLNGTEVFRSDSMPPAPWVITYATLATNYDAREISGLFCSASQVRATRVSASGPTFPNQITRKSRSKDSRERGRAGRGNEATDGLEESHWSKRERTAAAAPRARLTGRMPFESASRIVPKKRSSYPSFRTGSRMTRTIRSLSVGRTMRASRSRAYSA